MTTREVADLLRVHRNTIDNERRAGRFGHVRIGTRVLFTTHHIEDYIRLREHRATHD